MCMECPLLVKCDRAKSTTNRSGGKKMLRTSCTKTIVLADFNPLWRPFMFFMFMTNRLDIANSGHFLNQILSVKMSHEKEHLVKIMFGNWDTILTYSIGKFHTRLRLLCSLKAWRELDREMAEHTGAPDSCLAHLCKPRMKAKFTRDTDCCLETWHNLGGWFCNVFVDSPICTGL